MFFWIYYGNDAGVMQWWHLLSKFLAAERNGYITNNRLLSHYTYIGRTFMPNISEDYGFHGGEGVNSYINMP